MAAASSTASDTEPTGPPGPIRTCVGCRKRAAATELLRVVAAVATGEAASPVLPDPRRRMPGRGAWVHPVPDCVELAQRRRAFVRALRVSSAVDLTAVVEYVSPSQPHSVTGKPSGTPQEMKS